MAFVVASKIVRVLVYRRGAVVTREARLQAGRPPDTVAFEALPPLLDDSSLRVKVCAGGALAQAEQWPALPRAHRVSVALHLASATHGSRPARNEALLSARLDEKRARARLDHCGAQLGALDALAIAPRQRIEQEPPANIGAKPRLQLLNLRASRAERLSTQSREAWQAWDRARRVLDDEEDKDARASSAAQYRKEQLSKRVEIALDCAHVGPEQAEHVAGEGFSIELSYYLTGAIWRPSYRLDIDGQQAKLTRKALIAQATGEDWDGVDIALSTALPASAVSLPELRAIRIGRVQPARRRGYRPAPEGLDSLFGDYDGAAATLSAAPPTRSRTARPAFQPIPAKAAPSRAPRKVQAPPSAAPQANLATMPGSAAPEGVPSFTAHDLLQEPTFAMAAPPGAAAPPRQRSASVEAPKVAVVATDAEASVADTWLRHDSLVLGALGTMDRGKLVAAPVGAGLDALEGRLGPGTASALVGAVLDDLRTQAELCEQLPSPAGYTAPTENSEPTILAADAPLDVPADGTFHLVQLSTSDSPCQLGHVVVPKEAQLAFRSVSLENTGTGGLLPGPVDIFEQGNFVLTSELRATPRGGRLSVGLGVDEAVQVARNVQFEEKPAGLLRGDTLLSHRIEVRVANTSKSAVAVEVRERVPTVVDGEKDIEVQMGKVTPPWEKYKPENTPLAGGYHWNVEVGPGQEVTLKAAYDIRIPSKLELIGGNRRDG